jgi:hypothetical protein
VGGTTIVFGGLLILTGAAGYLGSGRASVTALIPAIFGLLFVLLGQMAKRESLRKHAMHVVSILALVGAIAAGGRVASFASGKPVSSLAAASLVAMLVLCAALLALCVRSFIAARRRRLAEGSPR